jgi:hypothetical protein
MMKARTCVPLLAALCLSAAAACGDAGSTSAGPGLGGRGAGSSVGGAANGGDAGNPVTGDCFPGEKKCNGKRPLTCSEGGFWQEGADCPYVCSNGTCTGACEPGSKQCNGMNQQICNQSGIWQDAITCAVFCVSGECTVCTPGETRCKADFPQTCGADGQWQTGSSCPHGCANGACKDLCTLGEFGCDGNEVKVCDVGPPAQWLSMNPPRLCNAASGQKCDKASGTCVTLPAEGIGLKPENADSCTQCTGKYFKYASLRSAQGFLGGNDIDSYDDLIYSNRGGSYLDVYRVTLADPNGDPDQHPENPLKPGPIVPRILTHVKTYTKATQNAPMGPASTAELFALSDRIYSLGPSRNGDVTEFLFATQTVSTVANSSGDSLVFSFLGYGDVDGLWYAGVEGTRRVYSFHQASSRWVAEFTFPVLAGGHFDGLEVVVSPRTGVQYVYVSDMTSDYIGQYRRDPNAPFGWVQENLFEYTDPTGVVVEGMGFGAFNHFWIGGGSELYEVGGGDLSKYLE